MKSEFNHAQSDAWSTRADVKIELNPQERVNWPRRGLLIIIEQVPIRTGGVCELIIAGGVMALSLGNSGMCYSMQ